MYILLPLFFGVLSLPGILLYLGVTYRTSALGITCLIFTFFGIIIVLLIHGLYLNLPLFPFAGDVGFCLIVSGGLLLTDRR